MSKQTLDGTELAGRDTLVVGATGNVGFFLVDAFLRAGARVLAPSRSAERLDRLLARLPETARDRVTFLPVDISTQTGARLMAQQVREHTSSLAAVVASSASWHQTSSMLEAGFDDFRSTIETRLFPHYLAAETLLPLIQAGGSYTFINGPVAFLGPPPPGAGAIAVAATAQSGLMRAIAAETAGRTRVNEVVMHAFLGPQGTRRGSPLRGEQVGDYVASLVSSNVPDVHGRTLHLQSPSQVQAALAGDFG